LVQITDHPDGTTVFAPSFSPDSQWIAFARSGVDGKPDIYVMRRDGSELTPTTRTPVWESAPDWSPDAAAPAGASPLQGQWQAPPLTQEATAAALEADGLGEWIDEVVAVNSAMPDPALSLDVHDGWNLDLVGSDGQRFPIDHGSYEVDGDRVHITNSAGTNTLRWSIEHDALTFEFVESDRGGYAGIPEEVLQTVLYEVHAFTQET
jgi:WD40-like Beta Propeller Repeat